MTHAPRTHHVQIDHAGVSGRLLLDGVDISRGVQGCTWECEVAGVTPRLTLELMICDVTRIDSAETEVLIPDTTAEALVALGWTPPTADKES